MPNLLGWFLIWMALCVGGTQPTSATDMSPSPSVASSLRHSLEMAKKAAAASKSPVDARPEEVLEQKHLLGEIVASLQHSLDAMERLPELQQRAVQAEIRARDWTSFSNPPPYSILLVDRLREELDAAIFKAQAADARIDLLKRQGAEGGQRYKAAEVAKRQSDERVEETGATVSRDRQLWLGELVGLRARAAAASMEEARHLQALTLAEADEQRGQVRLLEKQIATARQTSFFSQADRDAVLADLDRKQPVLERQAEQAQAASQRSRQTLIQAQAASKGNNKDTSRRDHLEKTVELRRLQSDNDELDGEIKRRTLEIHAWERSGWQLRWILLNSGDRDKLREALSEVDQLVQRLQAWNQYLENEIAGMLTGGEKQNLEQLADLSKEKSTLATQIQAAQQKRSDILRNGQRAIAGLQRTLNIWRQDFQARDAERSPAIMARDVMDHLWQGVLKVWRFEIFTAEDALEIDGRRVTATHSVTVGKSIGVVLFLVVGYFAIAWMSRHVGRFAVRRLKANTGYAAMISRWLHFILLAILTIIVLYMVNIPLTVFAFLGGALAIGLGFGTQVLLKNLVSGVMLLMERPLRMGDLIEVGAIVGNVTDIGVRSSTIRTFDGIEILVPNSTFVENNVTNWTYSSAKVRRSIKVGVDYAASPQHVRDVLLQVVTGHEQVLSDPEPRVLLEEFGSDAMTFNIQYWIDYSKDTDAALVASELRFMIKKSLDEAGIAIPFPQRVVHIKKG